MREADNRGLLYCVQGPGFEAQFLFQKLPQSIIKSSRNEKLAKKRALEHLGMAALF